MKKESQVQLKAIIDDGMSFTANSLRKTLFRVAISYQGKNNLKQDEIFTKEQLKEAIYNLLETAHFTFSVLSLANSSKTASLETNFLKKYHDHVQRYSDWYKETFKHWREILRQANQIPEVTSKEIVEMLLNYYKDKPEYLNTKSEYEAFQKAVDFLITTYEKYMNSKTQQKFEVKRKYEDLLNMKEKQKDAYSFMFRLFLNATYSSKIKDKEDI